MRGPDGDGASGRKFTRRRLVVAGAGLSAAGPAAAQSLADVPDRAPGALLGGRSERSSFVAIARVPEGAPGMRRVSRADAINSKTPLQDLVGSVTPSDLHYERSHAGAPDLNPKLHRLLVHGRVQRPLVLSVDDLKAMPSVTRTVFIECTGNGWENWKAADPSLTVQDTHGLVSNQEWTGVPLRVLVDLVGRLPETPWMLAEGADGAAVARSLPLTDEILDECFIAYGQNGEPLRPAHGFPMRLITPGLEGNLHIKWLRRLKFGDRPWMTRWETARYTQLQADGSARQFQLRMETNSVITNPSGTMTVEPGHNLIRGLAWSGHGRIAKVDVSTDGAATWTPARLVGPVLPKAQCRFEVPWIWDGRPTRIVSRATDETGRVQPDRATLIAQTGTNALFHYNAHQTWSVGEDGMVRNVLA
jgi:sulfane dehydrogenase subunit SoxC